MTIHAAKGLEFPVVFIPYLYKRYRNPDGNLILNRGMMGIEINLHRFSNEKRKTFILKSLAAEQRKKEEEEKKRLFYVAMTRAENHLIFTGMKRISDKEVKHLMSNRVEKNWCREIVDKRFDLSDRVVKIASTSKKDSVHFDINWNENSFVTNLVERDLNKKEKEKEKKEKYERVEIIERSENDEIEVYNEKIDLPEKIVINPSGIQNLFTCPVKYYISNCLGVGEDQVVLKSIELEGEAGGKFYGSVIHRCFESNFKADEDKIIKEIAMNDLVEITPQIIKEAKGEIEKAKETYLKSGLKTIVDRADLDAKEAEIEKEFDNFVIKGKMDRLLKVDKEWWLIDYKTDADIRSAIKEGGYDKQLLLYSACVGEKASEKASENVKPYIYAVWSGELIPIDTTNREKLLEEIDDISCLLRNKNFEEATKRRNKDLCEKCKYRYLNLSICSER